jgi:Mn2+/Fe2+ NRAMP family transporter
MPLNRDAILAATATVGTTLAPWGLAFIQSYAVDKRLSPKDLVYERIDVVTGAVMTGVIGLFVIVACAATLHAQGGSIDSASDAATALKPLAGSLAGSLFGAGLVGAGLLAASILPLSTAYSVGEAIGSEVALDDPLRDAPLFYGTYAVVVIVAVAVVLMPGIPLIPILYLTQALNAVLLLPLLVFIYGLSRDRDLMGVHVSGRWGASATLAAIGFLALCLASLAVAAVM